MIKRSLRCGFPILSKTLRRCVGSFDVDFLLRICGAGISNTNRVIARRRCRVGQ